MIEFQIGEHFEYKIDLYKSSSIIQKGNKK